MNIYSIANIVFLLILAVKTISLIWKRFSTAAGSQKGEDGKIVGFFDDISKDIVDIAGWAFGLFLVGNLMLTAIISIINFAQNYIG